MIDSPDRRGRGTPALVFDRRRFLGGAMLGLVSALASSPFRTALAAAEKLRFGPGTPFSFDALTDAARRRAQAPYRPPPHPVPDLVRRLVYQVLGKIHYRTDHALFADGSGVYPVTFFPLGKWAPSTVRMYEVSGDDAREIRYAPSYFDMPIDSIARNLPSDAGFAGFHIHESRNGPKWKTHDWVAFQGASYFRAIGALGQYGMSARGIAIDTALPTPEEFPDFVAFYIAPAMTDDDPVMVHALLDGPSVTGAYRFALKRTSGVVMDIDARLFLRGDVERFGIAPLTSMFWYGEYGRERLKDWRPEVHDSDGLALWTGSGERLWRPLNDPERTVVSSFLDDNPRGFGLLQRDRDPSHYLDGVLYERRPSVWVEPLGRWGKGSVQLVEIPTDDEIHDNIGAFWVPAAPARAGGTFEMRYRLHWLADEPYPARNVARVAATRMGRGGEPGKPRPPGVRKFVVSFAGGPLDSAETLKDIKPVVTASRGVLSYMFVEPVPDSKRLRMEFDLTVKGTAPVELRAYLQRDGKPLTETWLYQYHPPA